MNRNSRTSGGSNRNSSSANNPNQLPSRASNRGVSRESSSSILRSQLSNQLIDSQFERFTETYLTSQNSAGVSHSLSAGGAQQLQSEELRALMNDMNNESNPSDFEELIFEAISNRVRQPSNHASRLSSQMTRSEGVERMSTSSIGAAPSAQLTTSTISETSARGIRRTSSSATDASQSVSQLFSQQSQISSQLAQAAQRISYLRQLRGELPTSQRSSGISSERDNRNSIGSSTNNNSSSSRPTSAINPRTRTTRLLDFIGTHARHRIRLDDEEEEECQNHNNENANHDDDAHDEEDEIDIKDLGIDDQDDDDDDEDQYDDDDNLIDDDDDDGNSDENDFYAFKVYKKQDKESDAEIEEENDDDDDEVDDEDDDDEDDEIEVEVDDEIEFEEEVEEESEDEKNECNSSKTTNKVEEKANEDQKIKRTIKDRILPKGKNNSDLDKTSSGIKKESKRNQSEKSSNRTELKNSQKKKSPKKSEGSDEEEANNIPDIDAKVEKIIMLSQKDVLNRKKQKKDIIIDDCSQNANDKSDSSENDKDSDDDDYAIQKKVRYLKELALKKYDEKNQSKSDSRDDRSEKDCFEIERDTNQDESSKNKQKNQYQRPSNRNSTKRDGSNREGNQGMADSSNNSRRNYNGRVDRNEEKSKGRQVKSKDSESFGPSQRNQNKNRDTEDEDLILLNSISSEVIEKIRRKSLDDRLQVLQSHKHRLLQRSEPYVRRFVIEVLFDQLVRDHSIKLKYVSPTISTIFHSSIPVKKLIYFSDSKSERVSLAKQITRMIANKQDESDFKEAVQSLSNMFGNQQSIQQQQQQQRYHRQTMQDSVESERSEELISRNFYPISMTERFSSMHERLKASRESSNNSSIQSSEDGEKVEEEIISNLLAFNNKLNVYRKCKEFADLLRDIISRKANQFFTHSASAELLTSFLSDADICVNYVLKALADPFKARAIFDSSVQLLKAMQSA